MGKILIISQKPTTRQTLLQRIFEMGYELFETDNGDAALETIKKNRPEVVLFDAAGPDAADFEICQRLRNEPNVLFYTIMLTAEGGKRPRQETEQGADIYVSTSIAPEDLLARIRVGLQAIKKKRASSVDALSGLYNRDFFNLYLVQEVERSRRYQRHLTLMLIDIDHFESINDAFGYIVGDVILEDISKIVLMLCRQTDVAVRWGGEEFAILLPETDLPGGTILADRIRQAIEAYTFEGVPSITACVGVSSLKTDEQDLFVQAESALYKAKKAGTNRVIFSG